MGLSPVPHVLLGDCSVEVFERVVHSSIFSVHGLLGYKIESTCLERKTKDSFS